MIAAIEPTVFIVIAVFVLTILGVAWGLKTRQGSGINEHPDADEHGELPDPGAEGAGKDLLEEDDRPESTMFDQHGTK